MRYLKTFENFLNGNPMRQDLGRFSQEEEIENGNPNVFYSDEDSDEEEYLRRLRASEEEQEKEEECEPCGDEEESLPEMPKRKVWGDEVVEAKKAKPDFLDLDKDGNKKESMKKAAKDAKEKDSKKEDKEDKKEEKGGKGLSAAQKKLPAALQKAILAKKKK